MKITDVEPIVVSWPPFENSFWTSLNRIGQVSELVVLVHTDEGITGIGEAHGGSMHYIDNTGVAHISGAGSTVTDILEPLLIGENPLDNERLWSKMFGLTYQKGWSQIGATRQQILAAMAAVDIALWDIKGKALGQSVCSLLGGYRDRAPTYASGALMRPMNLEYLAEAGPRLVEMGFKQMKTQMGAESTVRQEVDRMRVLRDAIGEDIDLMCDINQLWNVNQAIEVGRRVEEYHLFWLEDVVAHDDYPGLARVADALTTPIAAGEYVYGITPFRHMLEARSIDIVMIDLLRVGGITQWRKVAGMAEAFDLPVVSHLIPEIHVQLVAAVPNGLTVEYMPWTLRLFEDTPAIVDGQMVVPDRPGLGLSFSQDAIRQYQVT